MEQGLNTRTFQSHSAFPMFLKSNVLWRERRNSRRYMGHFAATAAAALLFFTVSGESAKPS